MGVMRPYLFAWQEGHLLLLLILVQEHDCSLREHETERARTGPRLQNPYNLPRGGAFKHALRAHGSVESRTCRPHT